MQGANNSGNALPLVISPGEGTGQLVTELPPLTEIDRRKLLVEWNNTASDYPRDLCIHQLVEQQAARTPEAIAVLFHGSQLTYAELNTRANQLAHHLISLGVGPEVLVGLCVERSLEMVIGLLGILKAGGAYVPLDPGYPQSRLAYMLADTQAPVLLTQRNLLDRIPHHAGHTLCLDRDWTSIGAKSKASPEVINSALGLAYVIYTSGSTGHPKGVCITHRGLVNYLTWAVKAYSVASGAAIPVHSSVSFDLTVTSLYAPLLAGGTIHLLGDDHGANMLATALTADRTTYSLIKLTPAHLEVLGQQVSMERAAQLTGIFVVGGEQLIAETISFWRRHAADTLIVNEYGPTETTVGCCVYTVTPDSPTHGAIPIGRPIANTRLYILDPQGQPVPVGVTGELYVGGDGVGRGYLNRPQLTTEKFLPDPFAPTPNAHMYRTGDFARYLADGNIEFLGRIDDQVKIRGYRIELGEVETVLTEHAAVRQAIVVAREDSPGDKRLVAYVVPAVLSQNDIEMLRAFVRERLPEYMQPAAYVMLESIPLTPNGKVDRRALPAPQYGRDDTNGKYVAPRDSLEELVASVWCEILTLDRIGVHDNFFELGGHSLLAAQLVVRLAHLLRIELTLQDLFTTPVVSTFSDLVRKKLNNGSVREFAPIAPLPRTGNLPLSFAQQRLWFLDQLLPDKAAYSIPAAWRLCGRLDVPALERSLNMLVARHEVLRTHFTAGQDNPVQVVDPPFPVTLPITNLSAISADERGLRARQIADTETGNPFNLTTGPMLRAQVLCISDNEHLLLLNVHHIACDGWSMGIIKQELSAIYRAFVNEQCPQLPNLPIQYADYAVWQRQSMQDKVLDSQLDYWKHKLADISTLDLPTDKPRPPVASYRGRTLTFQLPVSLTRALNALAQREDATLFMVLLTAFQVLLHRYTGQEDIAVGSPIAGRGHPELDRLIGFFVNTMVLRTDMSGDPKFRELLASVRDTALGAYSNQDLPFERLVEEIAPARDMSRNPLFQVMFALQNAPDDALVIDGVEVSSMALVNGTAKFDLAVSMGESAKGLKTEWEYATDLFDTVTIDRMAQHFGRLVQGLVADPEKRISALPLLSEHEQYQLLVEWNDTATDYPGDRCIHQLFEEQVARLPNALAVEEGAHTVSYNELNRRADLLADRLFASKVRPGSIVAIYLDRSIDSVIAILSVWKAGCSYVPIDPEYPAERVRFMLEDTQTPVILTRRALAGTVPDVKVACIYVDREDRGAALDPQRRARGIAVSPEQLAYVIYTSGSTGRPKGVCVTHSSLANLLHWHRQTYQVTPGDRATQVAGPAFDAAVWDVWPYLTAGASVHIPDDATRKDPARLVRWLVDQRITLTFLPTPLAEAALRENWPQAGTLRAMLTGGDKLTQHLPPNLPFRLVNHYGPTENTVVSTCAEVPTQGAMHSAPPIGRPLPNTRTYLLDAKMRPVPIGVAGELMVGGVQLADGYWNRPQLTAEKFLPDPFSSAPGARMYRTGDLARYLPDGNLEFLGRIDDQVKIRGYRIELGEIESVLAEHPSVRLVTAIAREDSPGDKRLVAYVVPAVGTPPPDVELLCAFLRKRLPEYMQPAAYVVLDNLPLTPNGKVDKHALPEPDTAAYARRVHETPVGEIETALAQIWADVLKLEQVGRHDNFFELGGHSLLAVSMLERMRRAGLHADIRALFATPTLAELAAAMDGEDHVVAPLPNAIPPGCASITPEMLPLVRLTSTDIEHIAATVPGGDSNIQDIYPLAPLQEGILFHHQMATDGDPYLLSDMFGFVNRTLLQRYLQALQAVIDRHDILRTSVVWEGLPEPVQVVWRQAPLSVEEINIVPTAGDATQQLRVRFDPRHHRLDVRRAPLISIFIAHDVANARWVMLQLFHHLAIDHTTVEIIQQEIQAHLLGQFDELPISLPFRNFVAQARLGASEDEHKAFFRKMLGDVEKPTTPFGLSDVHGDGSGIAEARHEIDSFLASRLRRRARALGVSPASVCHVAWALVLARTSGQDDVVFGTLMFGRMQAGSGAARVLGLFINTLPIRIQVDDKDVQDSVRHTHVLLAQLLHHEHAPLVLAQRCSAVSPLKPLFNTILNYRHNTPTVEFHTSKAQGGIELLGSDERTNYPIAISVDDLGTGFALQVQSQSPLDPLRICNYMHTALEQLVDALENAPAAPLRSLDVLPKPERHQLLVEWNDTATDYPGDRCIHQLFEEQVARLPNALAVEEGAHTVSYNELNRRADLLADRLFASKVRPGSIVAIYLDRSIDSVIAILSVWKAGCSYVPIDPEYPAERVRFMLEDTQTPVILTRRALAGTVPDVKVACIYVDREDRGAALDPQRRARGIAVSPEQLAYVIYTSGSTGRPKGVCVTHSSLANLLHWHRQTYQVTPGDRATQVAGPAFDAAVWDVWPYLTAGASVHIPDDATRKDPARLVRWLVDQRITLTFLPTPLAEAALRENWPQASTLRAMLTGGDKLTQHLPRNLPFRLVNHYGPTENTVVSTCAEVPTQGAMHSAPPIGRPLPNTRTYLLDAKMRPVPIGVAGELMVGGVQLADGYWNRPQLTAEKFLPDPFSSAPGARMYRTGDLARYLPDGNLEFLGRIDDQVKIRGYRIELGEIESVLAEHPSVRLVTAIAREDSPGDKRLVAYVVPAVGTPPPDVELLCAFLRKRLPEYMQPAAYVVLDNLPLTPNGKVDKHALPEPDTAAYARRVHETPVGEIETALAQIWADVLKLEQVGRHDNFFELGGHSLLAAQLMSRVNQCFGVDLPLRKFFDISTIAQFAEEILQTGVVPDSAELEQLLNDVESLTEDEAERELDDGRSNGSSGTSPIR